MLESSFAVLHLEPGHTLGPVFADKCRQVVHVFAREIRAALGVQGLHDAAPGDHILEHLEVGLGRQDANIDQRKVETQVGLVVSIAIDRLLVSQTVKGVFKSSPKAPLKMAFMRPSPTR